MIDAYPRTPPGTTRALADALDTLPPLVASAAFGRFPVGGLATWSHDWLFPRHRPSFHLHEGTDVFARRGTPVRSPAAGTVRVSSSGTGGRAVKVVQDDGTYWYLAHLQAVHVATGDEVGVGATVGSVGDSGNAKGGAPHVHVEVHPHGGEAIDPKPLLDRAYADALAAAPAAIAAFEARALLKADRLDPEPPGLLGRPTDVEPLPAVPSTPDRARTGSREAP